MTDTRSARGAHPVGLGAVTHCPSCGGALTAVTDGAITNFLCEDCLRCWHVELGYAHRVDPATCPGCSRREECLTRWGTD